MHACVCVIITYRTAVGGRRILHNVVDDMRRSSCAEQRKPETGMLLTATATQHHFQFLGHCATLTLSPTAAVVLPLPVRVCVCVCECVAAALCWPPGTANRCSLRYLCFSFLFLFSFLVVFNLPTCLTLSSFALCFNNCYVLPSRNAWLKFWAWLSLPPLHNFFAHSFTIAFISLTRRHKRTQMHARKRRHRHTHSHSQHKYNFKIDCSYFVDHILQFNCYSENSAAFF